MKSVKRALFLSFLIMTMGFSVSTVQASTNVSGSISTSEWNTAGSPYIVTGTVTVAAGATLTIDPGVTVQFNSQQGMYVDGTLYAVGTSQNPITFTGAAQSNGYWASIYIRGAGSANLQYCDVAYGGYNDYYNNWNGSYCLLKTGSGSLTLENSTIRNSITDGFGLYAGSSSVSMSNNIFRNHSRYGVKLGINASFDDNTSDFSDNAGADLYADGGEITGDVTWSLKSDYSLYVSSTITIAKSVEPVKDGVLTIRAGTVVKFAQHTGIYIDGQMLAQGTAASPIYFTDWRDDSVGGNANKDGATTGAPGWWASIYIRNAGSATLEWCNLAYGGYTDYYDNWSGNNGLYKTGSGNLAMTGCTVSNSSGNGMVVVNSVGVTISQCTFTNNTRSGLVMNSGPVVATNCEFSTNGYYGILQEVNDSLVYTGNTFTGNTLGGVGVNGGTINRNITWRAAGSPFRVTGSIAVAAGSTLTIEAGVTVQFNQQQGMYVDGTLQAVGTSQNPITFTGASPSNGYWASIYIRGTGSANLQYCDVAYGGYTDFYNNWSGNHCLLKAGTGSFTLKNSTIRNSIYDGLELRANSSSVVMSNNIFKDNGRWGVRLGINASFDDNTSDFSGNVGADAYVDGGEITGPVVWSLKSAYSLYVSSTITVAKSTVVPVKDGVLTIRPGTVVKFAQHTGIYIDGQMLAQGTATSPIYFTDWRDDTVGGDANKNSSADGPSPGWWASIYIRNAGFATLEYCHLAYGGYTDYYNAWSGNNGLYKTGSGDLTMTGCTVSNSSGNGMVVVNSVGVTISQCAFTNNAGSGLVMNSGPAVATNCEFSNNGNYGILQEVNDSLVYTGNTFIGNTLGGVGVNGGTINGNITWRAAGSPFRVTGSITVAAGATLTIEPGVVIQFNQQQGIWIDGTLQAVGIPQNPITFTGASQSNGYWASIYIRGTGSANLQYCDVAYGGYTDYYNAWSGNHCLLKTSIGSFTLKNSIIRNSSYDGLELRANSSSVVMSNNIFKDNSRFGVKLGINASFDDNTSDFSGNASADMYADGGVITGDAAWSLKSDYSLYVSSTITVGAERILTIKPGTVVKFAQNTGIYIDGQILAQGTAASPIYFTDWRDDSVGGNANKDGATTGAQGWWASIYIRGAGSATLEYCHLVYGGYTDYYNAWSGNNGLYKSGSGDLTMTGCTVSNSSGNGMKFENSTGQHSISRNTFTENPTGVYIFNQSQPLSIKGNLIEANTNWGMLSQSSSAQVDARSNWWGDETGPTHASNPGGHGDKVSAGILFNPWRTSSSTAEILAPMRSGTLVQGDSLRFMGSLLQDAGAGYSWNFSDGRTSSDRNPGVVKFPAVGDHVVEFRAVLNGQADPYPDTRTFTVVTDTGAYPDLQVTGVTIPNSLAVGQPATITYTARNAGNAAITGTSWKDAVYFSDDPYLDAGDELLGKVTVESDVAVGASYQGAIDITLPASGEGAHYLILSVNDEWQFVERHRLNNEQASAVNVMIPSLESDVNQTVNYGAGHVEQYYRLTAAETKNLMLDFSHAQSGLTVYARYGSLPTRSTYDYRLTGGELSIPSATAGQWYILIYGDMSSAGQYTIGYSMTDLALSGVSPNKSSTLADAELTLTGAGFISPLVVELVNGGTAYPANSVEVDSFTQAVATFTAGSVPAGTYTVRVSHGGKSSEQTSAVEIVAGGKPNLVTRLILPARFGYHQLATVYVEYENTGNASMPAPLLLVTASQNNQNTPGAIKNGAIMTLDPTRLSSGFWTSAMPAGFSNSVQFLASGATPGILQPGESRRVPVYYAGWQQPWAIPEYPPFEWNVGVLDADNDTPIAWTDMKDNMRPAYVRPDAWDVVWNNFTSLAGATWGDYVAMLSKNALYLNRLGQRVDNIEPLLSLTFRQADGLSPLQTLARNTDAAVEAPGLSIVFERSYAQPISRRFQLGPLGRGWVHNWQYALTVQADQKTVVITDMTGTPRIFQPDSRYDGRYLAQPGDQGDLRSSGGGYILTESNGMIRAFKGDGKLDYIEDTNGNRISCAYSGGHLTSLTHSSGPSLTITYNGGFISVVTDHLNRQTHYTYTGEHLTSVEAYDGRITTYAYDTTAGSAAQHAMTEIGLPDNTHRFFTYDGQGRLESAYRDNTAEKTDFSYGDGRVDATDAMSHASRFSFDYTGRLVKGENALGEAVQMSFDELGNLTAVTDPAGISTIFAYDRKGNLTEISDAMRQKTKFTYTRTYNRLASVVDARGNRSVYDYDGKGNLTSVAYPDGREESWQYNTQGKPTAWTNRRGNPINYTYDGQGRILSKTYSNASSVTYTYERDNLKTAVNGQGTTTFTYGDNDYLTRTDYPNGRYLIFTYDAAGRRQSSEDQLGYRVTYEYDDAGRLSRLADGSDGTIVEYEYDALGRLAQKTMGNGVYAVYAYDAANRLLSLVNHKPDGGELSRFAYTYDLRGRRISMTAHYGVWTYSYDDLGQLTRAVLASTDGSIGNQDLSYEYDALGNRVKTVENGQTEDYSANSLNQYASVGDRTYTYDADGNLVQETGPGGTTTYSYNDENRLIGVTRGADTWQYAYDALGNREAVDENGTTTHYVVDPAGMGEIVGEYATNGGGLIARYTYGFGLLNRMLPSGAADYYTFDPMGNASELTGAAGALKNAYAYQPFGKALLENQTVSNPFRFVGEAGAMADAAGLHYMRARQYDSKTGRFITRDAVGLAGGDANLYRYVMNSPINLADPTGLACTTDAEEAYINELSKYRKDMGGAADTASKAMVKSTGWAVVSKTGESVAGIGIAGLALQATTGIVLFSNPVTAGLIVGGTLVAIGPDAYDWAVGRWNRWRHPPVKAPDPGFCGWSKQPPGKPTPPTGAGASGGSGSAGSQDPNQKQTIAGFGDPNYVAGGTLVSYRVDFENMASASAPAQFVTVRDALSPNLDLTTVELLEVGFGNITIPIPPGQQYFDQVVDYDYTDGDYDFSIKVRVLVWLEDGKVCANFTSLDSASYELNPDEETPPPVEIGFLMPENGKGRGKGYVSFAVKPKEDLASSTAVRNIATIQFDGSLKIDTNQVNPTDPSQGTDPNKEALITFDTAAPASAVSALPAQIHTPFTISWAGTDSGAGIAGYDVYVKENNGPWVLMKNNTTETSAGYYGNVGNTYSFYSVAVDNAGNREAVPAQADASTVVIAYQNGDVNGDDGVNLADAILAAKIAAGVDTGGAAISLGADVNGDEKIGIVEMIYILQRVAGLR